MSDAFIPVGGTTANLQSYRNTVGSTSVDSEAVTLTDKFGVPISSLPVTVSNFPASQAVTGSFFQSTQPISAAALPLPAGAATDASLTATNPYRGTTTPFGGATGTVTVPSGARVVSISCHSVTGGTVVFFGATVPVPANNGFSTGYDGLVGPGSIVFAGTDSYYVAINQ